MEGLDELKLENSSVFLVTSEDPQIIFDIPDNMQKPISGQYIFEIDMCWTDGSNRKYDS